MGIFSCGDNFRDEGNIAKNEKIIPKRKCPHLQNLVDKGLENIIPVWLEHFSHLNL